MIKHKPIPETIVLMNGKEYKPVHGILELPKTCPRFNPIEEEIIIKEKKNAKKDKMVDETIITSDLLD